MPVMEDKYNDTKARYLAWLAVQNMNNKNLGVGYDRLIAHNKMRKSNIDFWIEKIIADGREKQ